jgi:hypothetical protein
MNVYEVYLGKTAEDDATRYLWKRLWSSYTVPEHLDLMSRPERANGASRARKPWSGIALPRPLPQQGCDQSQGIVSTKNQQRRTSAGYRDRRAVRDMCLHIARLQ